jgi:hypothetical protein
VKNVLFIGYETAVALQMQIEREVSLKILDRGQRIPAIHANQEAQQHQYTNI